MNTFIAVFSFVFWGTLAVLLAFTAIYLLILAAAMVIAFFGGWLEHRRRRSSTSPTEGPPR
jgi:hypothetical protein